MNTFFIKLLDISALSCFVICAVIVLRLCFKKSPAYIRCLLWSLVALRLILPVSIESSLSLVPSETPVSDYIGSSVQTTPTLPSHKPEAIIPPTDNDTPDDTVIDTPEKVPEPVIPPVENKDDAADTPLIQAPINPEVPGESKQADWKQTAFYVWLLGAVLMLAYMLGSYVFIRKKVRNAVLYDERIRIFNGDTSPFVLGIIKPTVYVPSVFNGEQLECILAHEKAHISRGDHLLKPFAFLLLSVYWFNPLTWLAYIMFCKDIELACDEKVIAKLSLPQRKLYSVTLLACSTKRLSVVSPLAFGEVGVKERVNNVMNYKKPSFWIICITLIAAAAAAVFFITSPSSSTVDESADSSEEVSAESTDSTDGDDSDDGYAEEFTKTEKTLVKVDGDIPKGAIQFIDNSITGKIIKLSFSTDVTDFKLMAVSHVVKGNSLATAETEEVFETLYSLNRLKAGTPFYTNVEWDSTEYYTATTKAIEFTNANGATEKYYIRQNPHPGTINSIVTEEYIKNYPTFYLSAISKLDENPITVQYVEGYKNTKGETVYTDSGKADELVEMYIGNTVTDFKILAVSWSKDATPTFKPLYELDRVKGKVYFKTSLSKEEALTNVTRAIEFVNPAGNKMRYYLRTHKHNTPDLFPYTVYLQSVNGSPKPVSTHASIERLTLGGGIDGILYHDFETDFYDLIRISVSTAVTDFKYLSVSWDENNAPVFETLFFADTLTPDNPFHAQTNIARDSALTSVTRAIEYKVVGGEVERFYIKAEVGSGEPFYNPSGSYHWTLRLKSTEGNGEWVNPNEVTIYVPAEDGYSFNTVTSYCDGTPTGIIEALTNGKYSYKGEMLPEGIEVNFFHIINDVIYIDLSKSFEDFIRTNALIEHQAVGSVVNTLLGYYNGERVFITVDGKRLERADGRRFSRPIGFYTAEGDSTADDETKYATLYLSNVNLMQTYPYPAAFDGTPQGLIDALIKVGELREGVAVNSFEIKDGIIHLDLNDVFFKQVDAGLMATVAMEVVGASFEAYYEAEQPIKNVYITIDGKVYQSDYE